MKRQGERVHKTGIEETDYKFNKDWKDLGSDYERTNADGSREYGFANGEKGSFMELNEAVVSVRQWSAKEIQHSKDTRYLQGMPEAIDNLGAGFGFILGGVFIEFLAPAEIVVEGIWIYGAFKTEAKWASQLSKRGLD